MYFKQKYFDVECHQLIDFIYPKFKKHLKEMIPTKV